MGENIHIFSNKKFEVLILEKIHITGSSLIKVSMVNILELWKELTRFARSKPLQTCWTGVMFGHL